ncbi:unnamed protein product [Allacma fusca]|uniref:Uncharacterized protein n=1 Tax=Allacma fusca TaxID=39272 RepID=A0A8J2NZ00_9HEXA|nr:unnamed protein product [Allacma fusca]
MLYVTNGLPPANPLITVFANVINFSSTVCVSSFKLRWNESYNQYEVIRCSLLQNVLVFLMQINLCWKIYLDIRAEIYTTMESGANIPALISLANTISLYSVSGYQFYYNWVNRTAVIRFVHQLQHNYCLRKMSTNGRSGIIKAYFLWKLCILATIMWFSVLPFEAPVWDFKLILENSVALIPRYFPTFVMNHAGLKLFGQMYVIIVQVYSSLFILLADVIGVPVFTFSYLITKEFLLLIKAKGDALTSKEFLKLYESFKEVQRTKNVYFSGWTLMSYSACISFFSLYSREYIDSLGLTGQDVDIYSRFSMIVFIFDLIVIYKAPADVCILCKRMTKILRGNLLLQIPIYKLRLILKDISDGVHGSCSGHFLRITPAVCGKHAFYFFHELSTARKTNPHIFNAHNPKECSSMNLIVFEITPTTESWQLIKLFSKLFILTSHCLILAGINFQRVMCICCNTTWVVKASRVLVLFIAANLAWKIFLDIKDATAEVADSKTNIFSYINLANHLVLSLTSVSQLYFNWVNRAAVNNFVHLLQNRSCLQNMKKSGHIPTIFVYILWVILFGATTFWFSLLPFEAPFLDLKQVLENSTNFIPRYFPDFITDSVRLKYWGQVFLIFMYVYCDTFIFLTDIYGMPVNFISKLITNEFMSSLAGAEEETLSTKEFLKLYESYKEVHQA